MPCGFEWTFVQKIRYFISFSNVVEYHLLPLLSTLTDIGGIGRQVAEVVKEALAVRGSKMGEMRRSGGRTEF